MTTTAFVEGLSKAFGLIVLSEIGDKTFFIAALMAMKRRRVDVFLGAWSALFAMTALSACAGTMSARALSPVVTKRAATGLFFAFGARGVRDACARGDDDDDELKEVEAELAGRQRNAKKKATTSWAVFAEAFAVTFLAEWGDRSQIATVGLAAQSDVAGVTLGGALGHAVCTGVAVIGGRQLADRAANADRVVTGIGGCLFLLFGVHALLSG